MAYFKMTGVVLLGTLVIRMVDPEGQPMVNAELYVLNVESGQSETLQVPEGSHTLQLSNGRYHIYASKRIERGDFTDRYTTPVAKISVEDTSYENVILSARHYDNPESQNDEALLKKIDPSLVISLR